MANFFDQFDTKPSLDPRSREFAIRTVLGEAANEPDEGMAGVAAVIKNRIQAGRYGGNDVMSVVRAPSQFEPWGTAEGQRRMYGYRPDSEAYKRAGAVVDRVFGEGYDPTSGATHFYSPSAQAALGRQAPKWAQGEPLNIGRHSFYAPEGRVGSTEVSAQSRRPAGNFFDQFDSPAQPDVSSRAPATSPPDVATMADTGGRFTDNPGTNFRTAREGVSEAAPPKTTAVNAFGRGAATGLTANFYDELVGLAQAGGRARDDEPLGLGQILLGAYRRLTSDPEAKKAYDEAVAREREVTARAEADQPVASIAGNVVGGMALPLGAAAGGANLLQRGVQGAKAGAIMGGLSGVGEGTDLTSRATGGATGAVVGGAIGSVAPAAVEGVVQTGRAIGAAARPITTAVRGAFNPDDEAARRVVTALQRDTRAAGGPAGLTPGEFNAARAAGDPAAIVDLGGETTRGLARSAANTSPEAREALNRTINNRFESQSERVTDWLGRTFGPSDTGATREALQDAARRANRPAYARAYTEGDRPLWTPELQRLVSSPDVVDAMRTAAERGRSRAVTDGFGGFNSSVQISPTGVVQFTRGANGQPTYPNLQFWDYTKRALDDAANAARRAGRNDEASVLGQLATGLRNELDGQVPSYAAARAGAARFFGANDALEAGERFLTSNAPIADARRAFAAMSPPERDLFREGFVQSLTQRIESAGDRRNVLNQIAQSPRARQQMELAMGPQRAREFEAMMRVEGVMDLARGAVQGNSTTARQLTELGLAGGTYLGGGLAGGGFTDPSSLTAAALVWGATRGKGVIDQRVARRVGEMLASNDPAQLRRGINIVARNQSMMDALRRFDLGVARVGGQQSPGAPALQSMGTGRAEEDQPGVPRP